MVRFLISRLIQCVLVLWAVYTVTFFLLMMTPGDPFVPPNRKPPESVRKALAEKYGLDLLMLSEEKRRALSPLQTFGYIAKSYVKYPWKAAHGDLGPSIVYPDFTVLEILKAAIPVSLTLGSCSLLIALWVGVTAGTFSAVRKNRPADFVLSFITLLGVSLPSFVVGSLLLMAFVVAMPLLPAGGWGSGPNDWSGLTRLVLPSLTLAVFFLAYIARLSRSSTLDVLSADFVRTARAKGLPPRLVIGKHAGANAALPILSFLGPAAANVLVGSFVVERLFAIPGLGSHFVNGCLNNDIPLVLGAVMVYSILLVAFNLLVDLAYAAVDPRISLS